MQESKNSLFKYSPWLMNVLKKIAHCFVVGISGKMLAFKLLCIEFLHVLISLVVFKSNLIEAKINV